MPSIKEELIQEIKQAPEELLEQFLKLWQQTKQQSQLEKLSDFLRNSPLAEVMAEEEINFERDQSVYVDRFIL